MSVIFLFVDGIGLGEETKTNPFYQNQAGPFSFITGGQPFTKQASEIHKNHRLFRPIDATLEVDGLPQSGTGQTALFTGQNAAKVIGKHFGPFPHSEIKFLLREQSLFNKAQRLGKSCCFVNAYPEIFFTKSKKRNRWSCTTLMTKSAGIPLNRSTDVKEGRAVTAGLTQQGWREMLNIDVPEITPETAAGRVTGAAESCDLVLSEYYLTDKAGHEKDPEKATEVLAVYNRFLKEVIEKKKKTDTLVLCSDHGNMEDLSTKTHTRNKVPLFVYGPGSEVFGNARSILDITPGIIDVLAS